MKVARLFSILLLPLFAAAAPRHLSEMPQARVLDRGVLQVGTALQYVNISLAEALGSDINANQAQGVGEYMEWKGDVAFGLSEALQGRFVFSKAGFDYGDKEADIGTQELDFRYLTKSDFLSLNHAFELGWFRHSTNELKVSGSVISTSNILNDSGYGVRWIGSRSRGLWSLHLSAAYREVIKDGDGGQNNTFFYLGTSRTWGLKHGFEAGLMHIRIARDKPLYSTKNSDENNRLELKYSYQYSERMLLTCKGSYHDNLFRGVWPFLDREVDRLSFSDYGFIAIGISYLTDYR